MPNFDKTGPQGQGPMTGRGFGPCGMGLGWRRRFSAGRGMGRFSPKSLADYKKALEEELEDVKKEEEETNKGK